MTYTSHGIITIEAVIYQYAMYALLILSFQYCHIENCRVVTSYNRKFVESIQKFVVVTMYVYLLFSFPSSIHKFFSGEDLSEMRNDLYGDNSSGTLGIINRVFGSMPLILLTISCTKFFILNQWAKIDKYCIALYFLTKTNTILSMVSRSTIMFSFSEIIILFLFFRQFMSNNLKKKLYRISAVVLPIHHKIVSALNIIYTGYMRSLFMRFGDASKLAMPSVIIGGDRIDVGKNVYFGDHSYISVFKVSKDAINKCWGQQYVWAF